MFELIEAVASCLDRESARRVNRLNIDALVAKRLAELHEKERKERLTGEDFAAIAFTEVAKGFVEHLQRAARRILRKPAQVSSPR